MNFDSIGRAAVAWREAEDKKATARAEFAADFSAAKQRNGEVKTDEDLELIYAQTEGTYKAWKKTANAARSARATLTRLIRREQQAEAEALAKQAALAGKQPDLFAGVANGY